MQFDSALVGFATAFFALVVGGSIALPRIMSGKKRDEGDLKFAESQQKMLADMQGLFAQQLTALQATNADQQKQIDSMHGLIDKYRILLTQTRNVVVELEGAMLQAGVVISQDTRDKIDKLLEEIK